MVMPEVGSLARRGLSVRLIRRRRRAVGSPNRVEDGELPQDQRHLDWLAVGLTDRVEQDSDGRQVAVTLRMGREQDSEGRVCSELTFPVIQRRCQPRSRSA
jgi:hypothetical protein